MPLHKRLRNANFSAVLVGTIGDRDDLAVVLPRLGKVAGLFGGHGRTRRATSADETQVGHSAKTIKARRSGPLLTYSASNFALRLKCKG